MINVRQKGAEGEREIYGVLNPIIQSVMRDLGYPECEVIAAANTVQRNQNQSAVGGCDLTDTFGLAIEVKRQEQLSVNTWWKQCEESAKRNGEHPVLLYRQNRKPWRCVTMGWISVGSGKMVQARVEIDCDTFQAWFRAWVQDALAKGQEVRT